MSATQVPVLTVVVVDSLNRIYEASAVVGGATAQDVVVVRVVDSNNNVIDTWG